MTQLIMYERKEPSPLKSLKGTRNHFLDHFDGAKLTEEQQNGAAHYLTQLDCSNVV